MIKNIRYHGLAKCIGVLVALTALLILIPAYSGHAESTLVPEYLTKLLEKNEFIPRKTVTKLTESFKPEVKDIEEEYENKQKKVKWSDNFKKTDLKYLSCIIYCEANSMCKEAKMAVGNVILNRMNEDGDWAHVTTIKEVIYDRKWGVQFSPTANGSMERALKIYKNLGTDSNKEWENECMNNCIEAAKEVMKGTEVVPQYFLYFNGYVDKSLKKCRDAGKNFKIIEGHIYF